MMGRYKVMTGEFADLMLGYYGDALAPRNPEVVEAAHKHAKKEPITCRPADLLKPEWDDLRAQAIKLDGCNGTDEDVLTYAMFPQVATKFLAGRHEGPLNVSKTAVAPAKDAAKAPNAPTTSATADAGHGPLRSEVTYNVKFGGRTHSVTVTPA